MAGPKSISKSKNKKKPDAGAGPVNAPQRPRQPMGNEGALNANPVVLGNGGGNQPSVLPNESLNIPDANLNESILNAEENADDGGPDQAVRESFFDRLKTMGRDELRKIYLRVKTEGEGILDRQEFNYGTRRAYDLNKYELGANRYNPTNSKKLKQVQEKIDSAGNPVQAYNAFMEFAGNSDARLLKKDLDTEWQVTGIYLKRFQRKLKNMARMVLDYPELIGRIGDMVEITGLKKKDTTMAVSPANIQKNKKAVLNYNSKYDKDNLIGKYFRHRAGYGGEGGPADYTGDHELGHVLESLAIDEDENDRESWNYHVNSGNFLMDALNQDAVMSQEDRRNLVYHRQKGKDYKAGQINTKASKLHEKGLTTRYGETNAAEFFAEAFKDIYMNGKYAGKASIAVVKAYERRAKKLAIIRALRERDNAWLLHQIDPDQNRYSEDEEKIRDEVNNTYSDEYKKDNPDILPGINALESKGINNSGREGLNQWNDKATDIILELAKLPGGRKNSIYTEAERDTSRVMYIASELNRKGIKIPDLPEVNSRGVNPSQMLAFLRMSKAYQEEKLAGMSQNSAGGNAGGLKIAANEPLGPIEEAKEEEPKNPEAKPKNDNIINENLPPRNGSFLNAGVAGHNPQPSSVFDPKNPNSRLSAFAVPARGAQGQPGNANPEKKRTRYNRTELRVMEIVEAIENGEHIVFRLPESTRKNLRQSILDRALKAQAKVEEYKKKKHGKPT